MDKDEIDLLLDMAVTEKQRRGFEQYLNHPGRVKLSNRVFVYDIEQLSDKNETRRGIFSADLARFIGLKGKLPPPPVVNRNKVESTTDTEGNKRRRLLMGSTEDKQMENIKESEKLELAARNNKLRIDICDKEFKYLREILVADARKTTKWLTDYFLAHGHNVFVSEKEFFFKIIKSWNEDPC